jgi:hypothetical protein
MTKELYLKPCPFCSGVARFCGDATHECHIIVCSGCGITVDGDGTALGECETLEATRDAMATKWNVRV